MLKKIVLRSINIKKLFSHEKKMREFSFLSLSRKNRDNVFPPVENILFELITKLFTNSIIFYCCSSIDFHKEKKNYNSVVFLSIEE